MMSAATKLGYGLVLLGLMGCTAEKAGDPCDKFFQNTCKAPLSCVDMGDKKVCAGSCTWSTDPMPPHNTCKDPGFEPSDIQYSKNGASVGGAGCYCLPKAGGASAASAAPSASVAPSASAAPVVSAAPAPTPSAAPDPAPKPTAKPKPKPHK